MAVNSDNIIVRTIIKIGLNGTHSIMCGNWRHLRSKYVRVNRYEKCVAGGIGLT